MVQFITVSFKLFIAIFISLPTYAPDTSNVFDSNYDYIIVGGGSAGAVVASRLSEDPCVKVLLLEAGPDASVLTEVPAFAILAEHTENDWNYKTVPQKRSALGLKNQQMPLSRGKGLGGSSLLNFMLYVRGNKKDYDTWAQQGATGWSWKEVFPYFLKSEDNTDPEIANNGYHGQGGYLTVQSLQDNSTLMAAFIEAAHERGYAYRDTNGAQQTGCSRIQGTTRNGRRCSTAKAFLIPAQHRPNLDIVNNAFVTKILINKNKEAYGVSFDFKNKMNEVYATKEVIVSGGTINSPQILMLSGIGPKAHLENLGIPVIADLPVGDNLQDHATTFSVCFEATKAEDIFQRLMRNPFKAIRDYNNNGTGPLSSLVGAEGIAFINTKLSDPKLNWPDVQIFLAAYSVASDQGLMTKEGLGFTDKVYEQVYAPYVGKNTFTLVPAVLRPKSRGTIRLASTDPKDPPLVDPNTFQIEEDLDRLVEGMKECVNIVTKTKAFQDIGAKMFTTKFPGCESYDVYSDDYLRCLGKAYSFNLYHSVGTCKMGKRTDKTAVVDTELRVIGVKNLRVVDGSIIPSEVSGNTNAPIIMLAEKASDLIKMSNPGGRKC